MRDIKFRGKCTDTNEWVYGSLLTAQDSSDGKTYIRNNNVNGQYHPTLLWLVDPNSVGQYTGLSDSKMIDVYEGDVGRFVGRDGKAINGYIGYYAGQWIVYIHQPRGTHWFDGYYLTDIFDGKFYPSTSGHPFEVVGKLYENQGMLKS